MKLKIHPAIGIGRLGNSDESFIGPQIPGVASVPADGKYKDAMGRIRRQAAEFRIYDHDDPSGSPTEITAATPIVDHIEWTVQIANQKASRPAILTAAMPRFGSGPISDYVIAPSPAVLSPTSPSHKFNDGRFRGVPVSLGEAQIDGTGRLQILASQQNSDFVLEAGETGGYSGSATNQLDFANNTFWHDTTADGLVRATVVFSGGTRLDAGSAWVLLSPPKFAPGITTIVTLYDTIRDILLREFQFDKLIYDNGTTNPDPDVVDPHYVQTFLPSFTNDIYPILSRPQLYKWIFAPAFTRHTSLADYSTLSKSAGQTGENPLARQLIFNKLRTISGAGGNMPRLNGDLDGAVYPTAGLTLTRTQYEMMRRWKDGNFINDWIAPPVSPTTITAAGLDRAALESCIGGAFYPGIETNRVVALDTSIYQLNSTGLAEEIRLNPTGRDPGFLSADNALPWQADFLKCSRSGAVGWWPAARPDDVIRGGAAVPAPWAGIIHSHKDMVDHWTDLKFVVQVSPGVFNEQP